VQDLKVGQVKEVKLLDVDGSVNMKFFDLNNNGKYDWWEYIIPIILLLCVEVVAEVIAKFLIF
jgi:hypothetical protein